MAPEQSWTLDDVRWDERGLAPAIVQDAQTGLVLMLAYVDRESLARSLSSGETWFWSRSRQQYWHKGETSGNVQRLISAHLDCDGDTILFRVDPAGPACHTGAVSCFFRAIDPSQEAE